MTHTKTYYTLPDNKVVCTVGYDTDGGVLVAWTGDKVHVATVYSWLDNPEREGFEEWLAQQPESEQAIIRDLLDDTEPVDP